MKIFNTKLLLSGIVILAVILRFYGVTSTAPTLNWDEAALGYNAYSLGIDGKDEFGKFLPVQFLESYGDYKPVIYSYLALVPIKLLGLNEFSVRLPSLALGSITVLLTFFLVREIFQKKGKETDSLALLSAFILAISPWHIMLSRGAYEANVSTFFIVLGVLLFLKSINKNLWLLSVSAVSFALSFYTFNTARAFIPLFIIALMFGFRKVLLKNLKQTIVAGVIGVVLLLPIIPFLFSPQAKLRFEEVNIFSDLQVIKISNQYVENDNGAEWSKIIHNRRILYGIEFVKHYLDNFNPKFLFISGDGNPRFSTQDVGQLYILELPFLIAGFLFLFRKKQGHWWVIPVWLLLGIIPAATARETPHALRIETVLPTFQIVTAYGIFGLIALLKSEKNRKIAQVGLFILFIFSLGYFYHGLQKHYAREYSSEWQYPYEETVRYVHEVGHNYQLIEISEELGRPYIYFLFYGKYDPEKFRRSALIEREAFGFVHIKSFDKYKFSKEINIQNQKPDILYIDSTENVPTNTTILKTFNFVNGNPALVAYITNE